MGANWQRVWVSIPKRYTPDERRAIAQEIVEMIRKRTADGKDRRSNPFPNYSLAYRQSLDFKNAGKSASAVNLTLSGDMLGALDVLSEKPGAVMIGFQNGTEENARADGNIRGTYGQPSPIPGKRRDFLGLTQAELKMILARYPVNDDEARQERTQTVLEAGATGSGISEE